MVTFFCQMAIKTVIYDPKTLKDKEKSNKVLISKENAEGRGKIVPFFYLPHIPRFPQFMACSTPQLLNSNPKFDYDKLWNRCTSIKLLMHNLGNLNNLIR